MLNVYIRLGSTSFFAPSPANHTRMYESHFACYFFRYWGYLEGKQSHGMSEPLLGNMQNPFDALFGDVVGQSNQRFFIIEFKRNRRDFFDEVNEKSGKPHRSRLYQHLKIDSDCRDISRVGHFGGYPNEHDQLTFEPYAHCMVPIQSQQDITQKIVLRDEASEPLEFRAWHGGFTAFYKQLTAYPPTMSQAVPGFFTYGLGITREQLEQYVECMYQHLEHATDSDGEGMLGMFDKETGEFKAVVASIPLLIQDLHSHLARMRMAIVNQARPRNTP